VRTDRYRLVEWTVPGKDVCIRELCDSIERFRKCTGIRFQAPAPTTPRHRRG
jgi:hypothetical protein